MRVRPLFWGLLIFVCLGTLALAATVPSQIPAQLSLQLLQHPTLDTPATLLAEVTDAQGGTIERTRIISQAWMTNMNMATSMISTQPMGQGIYLVRINLSMVGPWMIAISIQADGFAPLHQALLVQVPVSVRTCSYGRESTGSILSFLGGLEGNFARGLKNLGRS